MSEISHFRPLALACGLALVSCADAGKSDAQKTAPAPTKTEAKVETKVETKTVETKTVTETTPQPQTPPKDQQPAAKYKKGQLAPPGLKPEELLEYNKAQGDPMGSITLEQALAGDDGLADKTKGKLFAVFDTTLGKFRCELFEDKVPNTVANFVGLARGIRPYYVKKEDAWKTGKFYDGTLFHRVIDGFMIQGGDPLGTGTGGPGFLVVDEFDKTLRHTGPGILSMANRGPNTGSSQFFVTVGATPHLDDKHAIFGKCDPKVPVAISKVKTRADRPLDDVKITSLTFERAKK